MDSFLSGGEMKPVKMRSALKNFKWQSTKYSSGRVTHSHGRLNSVGTPQKHEGTAKNCPNRTCQRIHSLNQEHKVPRGIYCPHGCAIAIPTQGEHSCRGYSCDEYSVCLGEMHPVSPWPCRGCSLENFLDEMSKEREFDEPW